MKTRDLLMLFLIAAGIVGTCVLTIWAIRHPPGPDKHCPPGFQRVWFPQKGSLCLIVAEPVP